VRVCVVVPAYNAAGFIRRAVESALRQSPPPTEIVVIDDGSTDATAGLVGSYGPPVRCVTQANAGSSAARNRGIRESRCEWVAFLDADDEWFPSKLGRQAEILASHPGLVWCGCNKEEVGRGWTASPPVPPAVAAEARREGSLPFFSVGMNRLGLQTSSFVIRRSILVELGGFDPSLRVCHDKDLFWRIAMRHPQLGYCPEVLYRYYVDSPAALTRGGPDRSEPVLNLCQNLGRARAAGGEALPAFLPYARGLAIDYLLRQAARAITIAPAAASELRRSFPPTAFERSAMAVLAVCPAPLARRIASALCTGYSG